MKHSFQEELNQEIKKRFSLLAILVSAFLFLLLILFVFAIQYYQLTLETNNIRKNFHEDQAGYKRILNTMNQNSIPLFLKKEKTDREIYSEYYELSAENLSRGILVIMDKAGSIKFTTQQTGQNPVISPNYLKTILSGNNYHHSMRRITKGEDSNHYLLMINTVREEGTELGYSAILLNGNNFLPAGLYYGTNYVIADQFDNVYANNANHFIIGTLKKINANIFNQFLFSHDRQLYLSKKSLIGQNIYLYTYSMIFPISVLALFGITSALIIFLVLFYYSKRLAAKIAIRNTVSIEMLVDETKKIRIGEKQKIEIHTEDEFEFLADNINEMMEELNRLIQMKIFLEKKKNLYEIKMLEAQFHPHFLYNTLENIRITSKIDTDLSERLILSLNRVLRYSIDHANEKSNLIDDLAILQDFLEVTKIRFEKFIYTIDVEKDLHMIQIPRLFLLPIVENAIKYGMKERNDLKVAVAVFSKGEEIIFEVRDNGPGFEEELIEKIYLQYEEEETHHGLINSYRRLKIEYPFLDLRIFNHEKGACVQFVVWRAIDDV